MRVAFGDSITYGEYCEDDRWTDQVGLANLGVCADTTRLALERFHEVRELNPDLVVVQFGHNDCNRWENEGGPPRVSLKAYAANLDEIVDRCQTIHAEVILTIPFKTRKNSGYEQDRMRYAQAAKHVAWERHVTVFDPLIDPKTHLLDDLHLNAEGHKTYADQLKVLL